MIRRKHSVMRVVYRFVSGRHLWTPTTDATFLYSATTRLKTNGYPSAWAAWAGWKRMAVRWLVVFALASAGYGYRATPIGTAVVAGIVLAAVIGVLSYRAVRHRLLRRHQRDWQVPLERALSTVLYPNRIAPSGYVTVPLDVHDTGEVLVELPGYVTGGIRTEILDVVAMKLGMTNDDTIHEWRFAGREQCLSMHRLPLPPKRVTLDECRSLLEQAKESAPVLGLGRSGVPVTVDLDSESPHVLIAASTGAGKSVISRSIAAQLMRHGAQLVVLDYKRQSHRWAKNVPGVIYARDIADIHDALVDLGGTSQQRNRDTDDIPDDVDTSDIDFPRIVILAEELNATMTKLQDYWTEIRASSDPKKSPAVKAFLEILATGRAVKMNIIAITQSGTSRAVGGPEARENMGTRILARATHNAWKMLAPEVQPIPKQSRHRGRFHVVIAGTAHLCQGILFTDKEARDWAMAGPVTVPVSWSEKEQGNRPDEKLYLLSEIAKLDRMTLSYESLRGAKSRDPSFPQRAGIKGARDIYRASDVFHWMANHPTRVE